LQRDYITTLHKKGGYSPSPRDLRPFASAKQSKHQPSKNAIHKAFVRSTSSMDGIVPHFNRFV